MRIVVTLILMLVWIEFVIEGISILVRQKGVIVYSISPWDLTDAPYGASIFFGILNLLIPAYMCYQLWVADACNILEWFKLEPKEEKYFYINLDLLKPDDYAWRHEIKERAKNKEKLVAYSKEGSVKARQKAKALGLEKYFVDFKSKEEVESERGW